MERSEIRERRCSRTIVPGLRFAPSGLRAEHDRDGSRFHRRRHLTKIRVLKLVVAMASAKLGSKKMHRENGIARAIRPR
jgi:hypothetical protein